MSTIIKTMHPEVIKKTIRRCRERQIVIPTFRQMRDPHTIPSTITRRLAGVGLWDVNPVNLFRITWKNDVKTGLYGGVNWREVPKEITGVRRTDHRSGRQVLSDRCAQGRRGVWLSRAATRERRVRSGEAQGGVAFDGKLLSRRRV